MPDVSSSPLLETTAKLRAVDSLYRVELGRQTGERWLPLDGLLDCGLDRLWSVAERGVRRRADYVAASVASALGDALVGAALPPLLVDGRLPDVRPANVSAECAEEEVWFERVALHTSSVVVVEGDPARHHPDVTAVAGSVAELHRRFVEVLVDAVAPWFGAIRARAPFGRRGMWGQLADGVAGVALRTARAGRLDEGAAWDEAHAILDLVAGMVPELRVRPRPFPVRWSGGETLWQVRGTCCLWYTTFDRPQPSGEGYCATCPRRDDDSRHQRLQAWLETEAEAAAG